MPTGTVYYTEFTQHNVQWRFEIFRGVPAAAFSSPSCVKYQMESAVLSFDDAELTVGGNPKLTGLRDASHLKIKVDLEMIPADLRTYITNPNVSFNWYEFNTSTVWVIRYFDVDRDEWNIYYVGTQRAGLLDDYDPNNDDSCIEIEVHDLRWDILDQIDYKMVLNMITNAYSNSFSESYWYSSRFAYDYLVYDATVYKWAGQAYSSVTLNSGIPNYMHFFKVSAIFQAIQDIMNQFLTYAPHYNLGTYLPREFVIENPLKHWYMYRQSYNKDASKGTSLFADDVYLMLFVSVAALDNDLSKDKIADGYWIGKSSVAEKNIGKSIADWLDKTWQGLMVRDGGHDWNRINAWCFWRSPSTHNVSDTVVETHSVAPPINGVGSEEYEDNKLKRSQTFATESRVVPLLVPDDVFADNYSATTYGSKVQQTQEFTITMHNMPCMRKGEARATSTTGTTTYNGTIVYIPDIPLGVLFYKESTNLYALFTSPQMIRIHSRAFVTLDATEDDANATIYSGNSGSVLPVAVHTYHDAFSKANWDIVAASEQGECCMPIHVAKTYLKIFGNPTALQLDYDIDSTTMLEETNTGDYFPYFTNGCMIQLDPNVYRRITDVYPQFTGLHIVLQTTYKFASGNHTISAFTKTWSGE